MEEVGCEEGVGCEEEKEVFCREVVDCGESVNRHGVTVNEGCDKDEEEEDGCEEEGWETDAFISLLIDASKSFMFECICIVCCCLFSSFMSSTVGTGG